MMNTVSFWQIVYTLLRRMMEHVSVGPDEGMRNSVVIAPRVSRVKRSLN